MWLPDFSMLRPVAALMLASLTAACFQPLYGERAVGGGSALRDALAAVDVAQIDAPKGSPLARIAVETRNELNFNLTGGSGAAPPTHRLTIRLIRTGTTIVLDPITLRTEFDNFGLDANFTLTEVASGKNVVTGSTVTRVTYNAPGQEQRFARARAMRDAETRAAKMIADQIRSRLASYFVAGT